MGKQFNASDSDAVYVLSREDSRLGRLVRGALDVLEEALSRSQFSGTALSFNGGKDCTVVAHLLQAARWHAWGGGGRVPQTETLFIQWGEFFDEEIEFVSRAAELYDLHLRAYRERMHDGLGRFKSDVEAAGGRVDMVVIGVRTSDPHGNRVGAFTPTDEDWPAMTRVHPILTWTLGDIWDFLRHPLVTVGGAGAEWCSLYDRGYTSLGPRSTTVPNPLLRRDDGTYKPAWELRDDVSERCGRGS